MKISDISRKLQIKYKLEPVVVEGLMTDLFRMLSEEATGLSIKPVEIKFKRPGDAKKVMDVYKKGEVPKYYCEVVSNSILCDKNNFEDILSVARQGKKRKLIGGFVSNQNYED